MSNLKAGQVHNLSPKKLHPDPLQPRDPASIENGALKELAASLKSQGVLQPIVVRQEGKKIIIVYGERRWRAAKLAKLATVPCILSAEKDLLERAAGQIAENVDREALNTVDVAAFLVRLQKTQKLTVNELVAELAKRGLKEVSHSRVERLMQLDELPAWAKKMLRGGELSEALAARLLPVLPYPEALALVQKEFKRHVQWTGRIVDRDVDSALRYAWSKIGRDLKRDYGEHRRVFNLQVCNRCEFKIKVGANGAYCLNPAEFDRKNAEAIAVQQEREAKKAAKTGAAGTGVAKLSAAEEKQKAKRKQQLKSEKVAAWFDEWLRPRVLACVASRTTGLQVYGLTYWLATGAVKRATEWSAGQELEAVGRETRGLTHQAKIGDLPSCLEYAMNADHKAERDGGIARAAVSVMDRDQLRWFARVALSFDLQAEGFAIDIGFLNLLKKTELIGLAEIGKVVPRGTGGVAALKADILAPESVAAIGVPKDVADLYARSPEPVPASVFKRPAPTAHDELVHMLGLDADATADEIIHALHQDSEVKARAAADEAEKAAAAKQAERAKKQPAKKPAKKKSAKKSAKKK